MIGPWLRVRAGAADSARDQPRAVRRLDRS